MATTPGYQVELRKNGVLIAGVRTKNLTVGNEAIDITTDDDSGFRTLMELSGQRQIDMSVEGLLKDSTLLQSMIDGTLLIEAYTLKFIDYSVEITGNFRMNNIQTGANYKEAGTFSAEIQSTGPFSMVPA